MSQNRNATVNSSLLRIVSTLCLMAGVFMLMVGGSRAYEAYSSESWPTTTGQVFSSRVQASLRGEGRSYTAIVKYEYEIEGEEFWNERIGLDPEQAFTVRADAETRVAPYPQEGLVDVYYNPSRPENSLLEVGFSAERLLYPLAGIVVLIVGFVLRRR